MEFSFLPEINWVDIIVLIFLIRGSYIGFVSGFSVEIFKILGAFLATILALSCYKGIGIWLAAHSFLSLPVANFLSFLCLFCLLLFLVRAFRVVVFKILHLQLIAGFESWGGLIFGIMRSLILASLFLFMLTLLPVDYIRNSVEKNSLTGLHLKQLAPQIMSFVVRFKPTRDPAL